MKKTILSWLLHHANKGYKCEIFYGIKRKLLAKYGTFLGYDFQEIEGKECWSCDGTGTYHGFFSKETCYHCWGDGWYRKPHWNVLERIKFGKYTFHTPVNRIYKAPEVGSVIIDGYVTHNSTKWTKKSRTILYLIYDTKAFIARQKQSIGVGRFINPGISLYRNLNNLVWWYKHKNLPF